MQLSQKIEEQQRMRNELDAMRENMNVQLNLLEKRSEELEKLHRQQVEQLETISGLSARMPKTSSPNHFVRRPRFRRFLYQRDHG